MEDSIDFCKSNFDDSCNMAAKGLSMSMDSPKQGKISKINANIEGLEKFKEKLMSTQNNLKLKGCVSEKRYVNDRILEDMPELTKVVSHTQQKQSIDYETGNSYHQPKFIQYFNIGDPRLSSFEDFLKTNNYFDFSMNGIFDDGQVHGSQQKPLEIPEFVYNLESDIESLQKVKTPKASMSMELHTSNLAQKQSPIGILNNFRMAEKKLCGAALNQNFKKEKNNRARVVSALPEQDQLPIPKILNFETNTEPEVTNFSRKKSHPGSPKHDQLNPDRLSTRSNNYRHGEVSISSKTSESRPSIQLDDMLRGQPQMAPSSSTSYKFVSESHKDGSKYEGYQLHGKKHGKGTLLLADESKYEGDWKNNMMSGIGKLTYKNGSLAYDGGFLDNKIHGHGVMVNQEAGMVIPKNSIDYKNFATVNKRWLSYEGVFNNGKKEGPGKWTFTTGEVFTGHFSNDMVSGVGRFLSEDRVIFGIWFNNIFIKSLNS